MKLTYNLLYLVLIAPIGVFSQSLYSNGSLIHVEKGGVLHVNGGMVVANNSITENEGEITITKNSSFTSNGNFELRDASNVNGNGVYRVEQDWINDANFSADNSLVELYGSTEQYITSTNGTVTTFNDLTLTGIGTDADRRKTLSTVDAVVGVNGYLTLNDRELNTADQVLIVENRNPNAISNTLNYNDEGFISSELDGNLIWKMNQSDDYIFPVGSSNKERRYRPVVISTYSSAEQAYAVRMNNFSPSNEGYSPSKREDHIDKVNGAYYHSIRRMNGSDDASLAIAYDISKDGKWDGISHWSTEKDLWMDTENPIADNLGNYNLVDKANWNFPNDNDEYALHTKSKEITITETFSPNNDGTNDFFHIDNLDEYPNTEVWIYTRWGMEVYHSEDYKNDWDGTSQSNLNIGGEVLPEGTYYYVLVLGGDSEDLPDSGKEIKGFVYLKR